MSRVVGILLLVAATAAGAQIPPSAAEKSAYTGLHAAAARGDAAEIKRVLAGAQAVQVDARDGYERTPLHVAAYGRHHDAMRALVAAGANPNALERDRYDIVTIAAVDGGARHTATLKALLDAGARTRLADRQGRTPLELSRGRGYREMTALLEQAAKR